MEREQWMGLALAEAEKALAAGEIPVGAVVVKDGQLISAAHNRRERDNDPTAHAEVLAIREAAARLGSWRLNGCELYVTLEPCPMCAAAMNAARVSLCVYGAADEEMGCCGSVYDLLCDPQLRRGRAAWQAGVREKECRCLLTRFFATKR